VSDTRNAEILVIHGPNLNMLGKREPDIYGATTLEEIDARLQAHGSSLGLTVETYQSNHEGDIVDKIQQSLGHFRGIIINPAAFTHTSIAIRDALLLLDVPIVEIHLSNIYKRESFRHRSMIADIAEAQISGFGAHGYLLALEGISRILQKSR
jgi:3-dehydroquinate dehydratase-2